MKVKEFLAVVDPNTIVSIYQIPIKEISGKTAEDDYILRQRISSHYALNSNQNYLDFEIQVVKQMNGFISVICKANKEQERKTIEAHFSVYDEHGQFNKAYTGHPYD